MAHVCGGKSLVGLGSRGMGVPDTCTGVCVLRRPNREQWLTRLTKQAGVCKSTQDGLDRVVLDIILDFLA